MGEEQAVSQAERRPAEPSGRQYRLWRVAMWLTVLHVLSVGVITTWGIGMEDQFGWREFRLRPGHPLDLTFGYLMTDWPTPPVLAGVLLAPLVVIACYCASAGRRFRWWLWSYWGMGASCLTVLLTAIFVLHDAGRSFEMLCLFPNEHYFIGMVWEPELGAVLYEFFLFWLPLPMTVLAALLTIGAGPKRGTRTEVGA
jgi:hypothetical protein